MITVESKNDRFYIRGAGYNDRHKLKEAGCRWDPYERGWYATNEATANRAAGLAQGDKDFVDPNEDVILGSCEYKGKDYYVLFHGPAKDGSRYVTKLCSPDGNLVFWAARTTPVDDLELFDSPKSIEQLQEEGL